VATASRIVQTLASAGVIFVAFLNAMPGSFARDSLSAAHHRTAPPGWEDYRRVDQVIAGAAPAGNVLLRFAGFDPDAAANARFAARFYYRAAYTLWPRRVFVAPPGRIINGGKDLLCDPFHPDARWLTDHQVRAVLEAVREPDGSIQFRSTPN